MKKIPIKLIEDHHHAYYFWKRLGISNRPLIHLDAHIDFEFHPAKPPKQAFEEAKSKEDLIRQLSMNLAYKKLNIKEESLINIGNYIYSAIRDGIVNDFYWVIPGQRDEFKNSLKKLRNILKSLFSRDPFETRKITKTEDAIKVRIYRRNFIFTTLQNLPESISGAILDIDTDYLATDTIRKAVPDQDLDKRFPWMWPKELVSQLKEKKIDPCCITIAYSVNGGFTPLIYKFLGDEVALCFNETNQSLRETILVKNNALALFRKGRIKEAIDILKEVLKNLDTLRINNNLKNRLKAHLAFILFRCFAKLNHLDQARFYYNLAISSDKTYRVRDNNYGPLYLGRKDGLKKAKKEFGLILSVDKDNPYALSGLASVFMSRKDFKRAKTFFKKAYRVDHSNQDALLGLSRAELFLKNYKSALKYLKVYKSKDKVGTIFHSLSAQAYESLGKIDSALKEYQLALRFRIDLGLTLDLLLLLRRIGIPEKHRKWIEEEITTYKNYRGNFFRLGKKLVMPQGRRNRIKRFIGRIDKTLQEIL